jgi:hypothetical protein
VIWTQSERPWTACEGRSLLQNAYASRCRVNHGERLLAQFSHDTDVPIRHFRDAGFGRGSQDGRNARSGAADCCRKVPARRSRPARQHRCCGCGRCRRGKHVALASSARKLRMNSVGLYSNVCAGRVRVINRAALQSPLAGFLPFISTRPESASDCTSPLNDSNPQSCGIENSSALPETRPLIATRCFEDQSVSPKDQAIILRC